MPDIVIKAENLGKKYTIGHQSGNGRYLALRDVLMQNARGIWHKTRNLVQGKAIIQGDSMEEFWALNDVSFEIQRGEAVGIIGRNGAGKSTLLKILSRITEPSTGRVTIKGRVASLLEVGTGFHPELTGRENIYLNGAILGMARTEITRKFDEIVAFAEVEKFLDTPVKRYSSGMYVRLAFAVAAHMEPEILVVDEVLAVGDAQFQKKCLGKMGDVAQMGRTVLFVSHNMAAISNLCSRGFFLDKGNLKFDNDVNSVIGSYLNNGFFSVFERQNSTINEQPIIRKAWFENKSGEVISQFFNGEPISLIIETENPHKIPTEISISFFDNLQRPLWNFTHSMHGLDLIPQAKKVRNRFSFYPPKFTISELYVNIAIGPKGGLPFYDHIMDALKCSLIEPKNGINLARFPEWPILVPTELFSEIVEK
ncbi:MAG: ABC transporter ATP-binding protein [Anaerolineaceae bacterium]|nr:ABC transporter ATP-binding protein [Anaerolineaceae bacterium]